MKTFAYMTLLLAIGAGSASAQSVVIGGTQYTEITDLNRSTTVRPQTANYQPAYTAQLPSVPGTVSRTTVFQPADQRPVLTAPQPLSQPTTIWPTTTPSQQYVYGYGYTSNGCNAIQPIGYSNTVPLQPALTVPSGVAVQPLSSPVPLNPYAPAQGVPWKPIVGLRQLPPNVVVGQGLIGQPKAYVPNQPVRNFIRYITP